MTNVARSETYYPRLVPVKSATRPSVPESWMTLQGRRTDEEGSNAEYDCVRLNNRPPGLIPEVAVAALLFILDKDPVIVQDVRDVGLLGLREEPRRGRRIWEEDEGCQTESCSHDSFLMCRSMRCSIVSHMSRNSCQYEEPLPTGSMAHSVQVKDRSCQQTGQS